MATTRYFDCFYQIIPTDYTAFSCVHLIEGIRCLYVLLHLSALEHPGWDHEAVRNTLDILQVTDYFQRSLQQAEEQLLLQTPGGQPGHLNHLVQMVRRLRAQCAAILRDHETAAPDLNQEMVTPEMGEWYLESMFTWPGTPWMNEPGTLGVDTFDAKAN